MGSNIFIGVDGGATQSRVRIEDDAGHVIGQSVGGPANIRLSVDESWKSIYRAIEKALEPSAISLEHPDYHFHLGLGLAGCEMTEAVNDFLSRPHSFSSIDLKSDAHIACLGAHQGKEGAIIVIGTGVVGYQLEQGQSSQVGGWGFPHDDEGGGAWLGLEAARLTCQWLDHRVENSPLAEELFHFFGRDTQQFIAWSNRANSSEFARLAPFVIRHVQQKEPHALRLIQQAARTIDQIGMTLIRLQQKCVPCSLIGGIAPFIEPWLCASLRERLVPRQADADAGAILMVREKS